MARILITAGPTHEYLDDVRYLANASSGRMGFALAAVAAAGGHDVVLIAGPTAQSTPVGVERIDVVSAREMRDRAVAVFGGSDLAFGVAAVADHRPADRSRGKPAKEAGAYQLELVPNPDIIGTLGAAARADQLVVGFALQAETGAAAIDKARGKLTRKHLGLVVLNGPAAMDAEAVTATLIAADGSVEEFSALAKVDFAPLLLERALHRWLQRRAAAGEAAAAGPEDEA